MDLISLKNEVNAESVELECVQLPVKQLSDLQLCLIGGGMGDVQQ